MKLLLLLFPGLLLAAAPSPKKVNALAQESREQEVSAEVVKEVSGKIFFEGNIFPEFQKKFEEEDPVFGKALLQLKSKKEKITHVLGVKCLRSVVNLEQTSVPLFSHSPGSPPHMTLLPFTFSCPEGAKKEVDCEKVGPLEVRYWKKELTEFESKSKSRLVFILQDPSKKNLLSWSQEVLMCPK